MLNFSELTVGLPHKPDQRLLGNWIRSGVAASPPTA